MQAKMCVCYLVHAGLRVELTGTAEDDGQHYLGRQWGVHLGLTQGGEGRAGENVFVISAGLPVDVWS